MTSVCLLVVLLFSEQGETIECAVWKDEHEHKAKTKTAISVYKQKKYFKRKCKKIQKIYIYIFFFKPQTEIETAVSG